MVVAGQKIHVGIRHAGETLTVEEADTTWRIHDADRLVTEVPRTSTKNIARYKVRKPEPSRKAASRLIHGKEVSPSTTPP